MFTFESKERKEKDLDGLLFVSGKIDDGIAEKVVREIIKINQKNELEFVQILINSGGGYTTSGFAIIDIMRWSKIPIYTTGLGMVASMGLLIFMAGAHGHRVLTPRTSVLSHRFSAGVQGNHSQLIAFRKEEDLMHNRIVQHYLEFSDLKTKKEVEAKLLRDSDVWLSSQECVDYGLADVIENDTKIIRR